MFLIASTGRTGTLALTRGLDSFSDHDVAHEPAPLLREAWLAHRGRAYDDRSVRARTAFYARHHAAGEAYGESVRTPNLLSDFLAAVPGAPLLVIVREPVGYVRSAYRCRVLRKGDEWDRYRLMPEDDSAESATSARLAQHWCTVNRYLLAAAAEHQPSAMLLYQPLVPLVDRLARFLGVTLLDSKGFRDFLADRPNRAPIEEEPDHLELVEPICRDLWAEARALARRLPLA